MEIATSKTVDLKIGMSLDGYEIREVFEVKKCDMDGGTEAHVCFLLVEDTAKALVGVQKVPGYYRVCRAVVATNGVHAIRLADSRTVLEEQKTLSIIRDIALKSVDPCVARILGLK